MLVTPAHPGSSAAGEAAPGLEPLCGVTWGHQCLPVPSILGGGNGAEGCSQTLLMQQFLKKLFSGKGKGSGIVLNWTRSLSAPDKLIYGFTLNYPAYMEMLLDLLRW